MQKNITLDAIRVPVLNKDLAKFTPDAFPGALLVGKLSEPFPGTPYLTSIYFNQRLACVTDDINTFVMKDVAYIAPPYVTPGMGNIRITKLNDNQIAKQLIFNQIPALLIGTLFEATLTITTPALNPSGAPDPTSSYKGHGEFENMYGPTRVNYYDPKPGSFNFSRVGYDEQGRIVITAKPSNFDMEQRVDGQLPPLHVECFGSQTFFKAHQDTAINLDPKAYSEAKTVDDVTITKKARAKTLILHKEYDRQLYGQEKAVNQITAQEFVDNYAYFTGEHPVTLKPVEQKVRKKSQVMKYRSKEARDLVRIKSKLLEKLGYSQALAESFAKQQVKAIMELSAALHNPDMVVGGRDILVDIGNSHVNSSIGSSWKRGRQQQILDKAAENTKKLRKRSISRAESILACAVKAVKEGQGRHLMNIQLTRCAHDNC